MLPFCVALMAEARHIMFLGFIMAILGFNMGCIDNVGNLSILKLYGSNVSPFIQVNRSLQKRKVRLINSSN